MSASAMHGGHN